MTGDGTHRERAERLAAAATHPSVKAEVLAGAAGRISKSYLHDRPPVTYLEEGEQPAYLLRDGRKGIGIGSRRTTTSPTDGLSAVTIVTDRRTLCLVGQSSGDAAVSVPHDVVADVDYAAGLLGRRLVVRTTRTVYHCRANRSTGEDVLDGAAGYIHRQALDPPAAPADGEPDRDAAPASSGSESTPRAAPGPTDGSTGDGTAADSASDVATRNPITYRGQRID